MSTYNLGVVAPTHKGVYAENVAYKARNIVTYNGGSYMAKKDCTGISPENTEYWGVVAESGQGSPIVYTKTFNNLKSDSTADKTKVYLITNSSDTDYTGHYVFWNGTEWCDGGEYGGIADGGVTPQHTNFLFPQNNVNILNFETDVLHNHGFNNNGTISDWSGRIVSGYSSVESNTTYLRNGAINTIAYFDENYKWIMHQPNHDMWQTEFTTPNDKRIKYLRVVVPPANAPQLYIMKKKGELVNVLNLVDGYEEGKALENNNTGNSVNQNNTAITGYTSVENNVVYSLNRATTGRSVFALYDENKNFLESYQIDFNSDCQFMKFENDNVKFVRFNVNMANNGLATIAMYDMSDYFEKIEDTIGNNHFNFDSSIQINAKNLDKSLAEKLNCINIENKENLIDYDKMSIGQIQQSTGTVNADTRAISTDFIKIDPTKRYTLYQPNGIYEFGGILAWDENKQFLNNVLICQNISKKRKIISFNSNGSNARYITIALSNQYFIGNHAILTEGIVGTEGEKQTVSIEKLKINYENLNNEIFNDIEDLKKHKELITKMEQINLLNLQDGMIVGKGISRDTGLLFDNVNYCVTGYCEVEPNTTYLRSMFGYDDIVYYNEKYEMISGAQSGSNMNTEFTTPDIKEIKYARFSISHSRLLHAFIFKKIYDIENILSVDQDSVGKYIRNDGVIVMGTNTTEGISEFIPIEINKLYFLANDHSLNICFYDENYELVRIQYGGSQYGSYLFNTKNTNEKYIKFPVRVNNPNIRLYDITQYISNIKDIERLEEPYTIKKDVFVNEKNLEATIRNKLKYIETLGVDNLFNKDKIILNKTYNADGFTMRDNSWSTSNDIEIEPYKAFVLYISSGLDKIGNELFAYDKLKERKIDNAIYFYNINDKLRCYYINNIDAKYINFSFNTNLVDINNIVFVEESLFDEKNPSESRMRIKNLKIEENNLNDELKDDFNSLKRYKEKNPTPEILPLVYRNLLDNAEIPSVYIDGDISEVTREIEGYVKLKFVMSNMRFQCWSTIKWQGSSSSGYPKKNFTIKLYNDSSKKRKNKQNIKWGRQNKYVLKANYIDHSHSRNIVSARLWSQIVNSRSKKLNELMEYSPNMCAIDGFPVKMYINNEYQGLYTFNIPKDGWMFNMTDEVDTHWVICADNNNNGNNNAALSAEFRANAGLRTLNNEPYIGDFSIEFPDQGSQKMQDSLNNLINCVKDTDDATFKANIEKYLDLESAIDYYIFVYFMGLSDNLGKNLILMSYDGVKWICSAYDLDTSCGLVWNGGGFKASDFRCPEDYQETNSLLWIRLEECFSEKLYKRYTELRDTVLNLENLYYEFEKFINAIPQELYSQDGQIYTGIPQKNVDHLKQIKEFLAARSEYVDEEMEKLVATDDTTDEDSNS